MPKASTGKAPTRDDLSNAKKRAAEKKAARDEAEIEANAAQKQAELADANAAAAEAKKTAATEAHAKAETDLETAIVAVAKAKADVSKAEADQGVAEGIKQSAFSAIGETTAALAKFFSEAVAANKQAASLKAELAKFEIDFEVASNAVTALEQAGVVDAPAAEAAAPATEEAAK